MEYYIYFFFNWMVQILFQSWTRTGFLFWKLGPEDVLSYSPNLEHKCSCLLAPSLCYLDSIMSNNSAANSSLVIAQKAVKQLRLEASVRRIKVSSPRFTAELNTLLLRCLRVTPALKHNLSLTWRPTQLINLSISVKVGTLKFKSYFSVSISVLCLLLLKVYSLYTH